MISAQSLDAGLLDCSNESVAGLLPRIDVQHGIGTLIEGGLVSGPLFNRPVFAEQSSCVTRRPYDLNALAQLDDDAFSPSVGHCRFNSPFDGRLTVHAGIGSCRVDCSLHCASEAL